MEGLQNIPCTEEPSVLTLELGFHCSGGSLHIWIIAGLGMPNLRTKAFRYVNSFGLIWNSSCSESRSLTALVSRSDIIYQSSQLTEVHRKFLCFRNLHCFGEALVREAPPAAAGGSQRKPESKGTKGTTLHKQTNISQVTVNVPALCSHLPSFLWAPSSMFNWEWKILSNKKNGIDSVELRVSKAPWAPACCTVITGTASSKTCGEIGSIFPITDEEYATSS